MKKHSQFLYLFKQNLHLKNDTIKSLQRTAQNGTLSECKEDLNEPK